MNRPNDPFIELGEIQALVGKSAAISMALELSGHIENTNNWLDDIGRVYPSVEAFIGAKDDALEQLNVDAYAALDVPRYVALFQSAGFDGAVHAGTGVTAGETE